MPLIQIKGVSGVLNDKKKQELFEKITDAVVSVGGEGLRPVTTVLLEEVPSGNWSVGGKSITTECVKNMIANPTATCAS
jgi:4-oxalocrotonate tautomerase